MFFPKHCDAWHSQQFLDIMLFLSKLSPMFMFRNMSAFLTYLVHCIQRTVLQHYSLKDPIFIFTDCEIVYDLQPYVALGNMLHSWLLSTVILILHPHICICLDHWKNVFKHHVKAPRQCKKKIMHHWLWNRKTNLYYAEMHALVRRWTKTMHHARDSIERRKTCLSSDAGEHFSVNFTCISCIIK